MASAPAIVPGTIALGFAGPSETGPPAVRNERLASALYAELSRVAYVEAAAVQPVHRRSLEDLSRHHREAGVEYSIVLDASPTESSFSLVDNRTETIVASGPLPKEITDSVAVDRVLGASLLHLDHSVADWGGLSSVQPSYAAARAFIESMRAWRDLEHRHSMESLEKAVAMEPWFPLAMLELAEAYGEQPSGDSLLSALRLRGSELSRFESLQLSFIAAQRERDRPRMLQLARKLGDAVPERFLSYAASLAVDLGQHELALELAAEIDSRRAILPNADFPALGARHALGRHEEEFAIADSLRRMDPETIWLNNAVVQALAALGRHEEIEAMFRLIETRPNAWNERGFLGIRQLAVRELLSHGHEKEAAAVLHRGLEILKESSDSTLHRTQTAAWLYRRAGDLDRAERINEALVEAYPEWVGVIEPLSELAMIHLERGDEAAALAIADRVASWADHETAGPRARLREASIHAVAGNADRALALLREALRMGLSHTSMRTAGWEFRVLRGHPEFDALFPHPTF